MKCPSPNHRVFGLFALALALYGARLVMAVLLAAQLTRPVSQVAQLNAPSHAFRLFAPGSEWLIRLVSEYRQDLAGGAQQRLLEVLAAQVVSVLVSTWVLAQIQRRELTSGGWRLKETVAQFPAQLAFVGAFWSLMFIGAGIVKAAYPVIPSLVYPLLGERGADAALACAVLLILVTVVAARAWCEVARLLKFSTGFTVSQTAVDAALALGNDWRYYLGISSAFLAAAMGLPLVVCCTVRAFEYSNHWGWASAAACQLCLYLTGVAQVLWWKLAATRAMVPSRRAPVK